MTAEVSLWETPPHSSHVTPNCEFAFFIVNFHTSGGTNDDVKR